MSKTLISWNVNGIRAIAKKGLMEWLAEARPDLIAFQEIKAKPEQLPPDLREPEGWYAFWNPAERAGYSGVAVWSRRAPNQVAHGFGDPAFDVEGRTLILWFDDLIFVTAYFPSGTSGEERIAYKLAYNEAFLNHMNALREAYPDLPILFCGDVNIAHQPIDLARPKDNVKNSGFLPEERVWIDHFLKDGFVDTFRSLYPEKTGAYSWWTQRFGARQKNVGWRIDYFFAEARLMPRIQDAFILPDVMGSDHCPVGVVLNDAQVDVNLAERGFGQHGRTEWVQPTPDI